MTEEADSGRWMAWAIKGILVLFLTFLQGMAVFILVMLIPWMSGSIASTTILLSVVIFLAGNAVLLESKDVKMWIYSVVAGFSIGIGCIALPTLWMLTFIPVPLLRNIRNLPEKKASTIDVNVVHMLYFEMGLSMLEIGRKLGFKSTKSIQRVFREQRWKPRRGGSQRKQVDFDELHRLYYLEGLTLGEIANVVDMDRHTISKIFREQGWKTRRAISKKRIENLQKSPELMDIDIEDVYDLYFNYGLTKEDVAEELNVTEWTIRRIFDEMDWKGRIRKFETDEERESAKKASKEEISQLIENLRDDLVGTNCRICSVSKAEKTLYIHKKDGTPHPRHLLWRVGFLRKANPENWVGLCFSCHKGVHWMMRNFGFNWEKIIKIARTRLRRFSIKQKPLKLPTEDTPSSAKYIEMKKKTGKNQSELREAIFGNKCYFCGILKEKNKSLSLHRKDGRPHPDELPKNEKYFRTLNPDEWVMVCNRDHLPLHWLMNVLGYTWDEIVSIFQQRKTRKHD